MVIRYIISSHVRYQEAALPRLLRSLRGVAPENIFVAIGGAGTSSVQVRAGVTFLTATHNSFDYTGPIEVTERGIPADWWFWLHDTCECGPRFRELAEGNFDPDADMTVAHPDAQCNFGMYRHELLMRHREYFQGLKDLTKQQAIAHEGGLFRWSMGTKSVYPAAFCQGVEVDDVYGTGIRRMREYYQAVDLYKYKANWGQTGEGSFLVTP